MREFVLQVEQLVKDYGRFRAVDKISFQLERGKVVGLLGPNGAGKTTTIQMLLGVTLANGGTIHYFGRDFFKHRQYCLSRLNYTSAFNTLLGKITVYENLLVYAGLYEVQNPKKRIYEIAKYFEVEELFGQLYQTLSTGQKTRVNLIKALINDPEILLMDEPTASLDPDIADKTLSLIEHLKEKRNISILYTSHDMNEVTRICDEVIFLDHGKIVAYDTPVNLTKRIETTTVLLKYEGSSSEIHKYFQKKKQPFTSPYPSSVCFTAKEIAIPSLLFGITKTEIRIIDIEIRKPTLEDVFLQIARGGSHVN
ncbi:ABC transporter ATP-binding protein [Candidatus Gottesmanbacteria bacterium]|nr:ABC transporter ATP-binding protein [Candidatus Gottesmanbacteria bacterium]